MTGPQGRLGLSELPALLSVEQACELLGLSRSAGYRAAAAGHIPRFAGATGSTSRPRGCSSCSAWSRSVDDDAERLDPQARQHLDLVHRGRARPEHRPAPPSL